MPSRALPTSVYCQSSKTTGSGRPVGPIIVNQFATSDPPPNWNPQQFEGKVKSQNVGD